MSGRHSWNKLIKKFSSEMRRKVDVAKSELREEIALQKLRRAQDFARRDVAEGLNDGQL